MRAMAATTPSMSFSTDGFLAFGFGQQHLRRADFVDNVDGFVGQFAIADIFRRKLYGGLNRASRCIGDLWCSS
jgi:hypothetical protein